MQSDTSPSLRPLLNARQLAEKWEEDVQTIYTLAREKGLPHLRFGRAIRFDPEAVSEWVRAGGTGNWSPPESDR